MSVLAAIQETEPTGEVSAIFAEIQRELGIPFVPNISKTLAISPTAVKGYWGVFNQVFLKTSLPNSLAALGNFLDTIADSLKLDVDEAISEALQR